ncbi:carboxymuconolactone decarboxylase family protein [Sphingomonas profundi]|uniref:carboxymuconolactone decarboxylase family protein n=1 Tax=Alterirhizorhabdus profundi TaxID=2681549 RepID=UPI0012E8FEED|nr:carboxymuconolactone decarboxylase family protein [Sphingomonas profundi]
MSETIRSVPREELTPALQESWDFVYRLTGQAAFIEKGAHAPELLDFTMTDFYGKIFYGGRVDEKLKHLARLRMSLGHGCRSCNLGNTQGASEAGYSEAELHAIEGDRSIFSAAEQAVLELADQFLMTNVHGHLEPDLYARLRAHFDDAQILELGTVMSYLGGLAKMLFVFDMAEKEETCPFVPRAKADESAMAIAAE